VKAASQCQLSVIVPTYREAENLAVLVPRLSGVLENAGIAAEILIVDDDSPDNTREVCESLAANYPVRLIVRKGERGLSSAVIHGMRQSVGDVLLVMDADLSHPPEKVPELFAAVRADEADFALGSRYVPGGGTDDNWGLFRWLNSKVATLLAWPLTSTRDPMSGFLALRKQTFLAAENLNPVGYKIGLELMVKCGCRHIQEIPILFADRLHGESKLSLREQFLYVKHLKRLYQYKLGILAQPVQFVLVGATGVFVDLAAFSLLLRTLPAGAARALAIWIAMTWNFWLNRRLTFSHTRTRPLLRQYALFCLSCLMGAVVNWSTFSALYSTLGLFADWPMAAAIVGILAGTVLNFLMSKYVAFK
jgi:dolichol-phosphate mannosyltransferase